MSTYKLYNKRQLQAIAEGLLQQYRDKIPQESSKDFDVYQVIEKCLEENGKEIEYDWKRLSCDGSILGMTAFQSGNIDVFEDINGNPVDNPRRLWVDRGTIIIDSSLPDNGPKGRENFTVMHEVFHWLLHQEFFTPRGKSIAIAKRIDKFSSKDKPHKKFKTPLESVEWQANYAAACFLMPEREVSAAFNRLYSITKNHYLEKSWLKGSVKLLAEGFNVTSEAMLYRIQELKEKGMLITRT